MAAKSDFETEKFDESELLVELECLEAIFIDELCVERNEIDRPTSVSLQLHPSTGEQTDQQYVCLTLQFVIPCNYPAGLPEINIRNPRGLAEDHVRSLSKTLDTTASERRGTAMMYDLIELAKESLTKSNIPHGPCPVCLEEFTELDKFTKTECYHYFHNDCLLRYIHHCVQEHEQAKRESVKHVTDITDLQVVCPVCRNPITYDQSELDSITLQPAERTKYQPDASMRRLQEQMRLIYIKQKKKGGIINIEEERKKFLIPVGMEAIAQPQSEPIMGSDIPDQTIGSGTPEKIRPGCDTGHSERKHHKGKDRYGSGRNHQHGHRNRNLNSTDRREHGPRRHDHGHRIRNPNSTDRRQNGPHRHDHADVTRKPSVEPDIENMSKSPRTTHPDKGDCGESERPNAAEATSQVKGEIKKEQESDTRNLDVTDKLTENVDVVSKETKEAVESLVIEQGSDNDRKSLDSAKSNKDFGSVYKRPVGRGRGYHKHNYHDNKPPDRHIYKNLSPRGQGTTSGGRGSPSSSRNISQPREHSAKSHKSPNKGTAPPPGFCSRGPPPGFRKLDVKTPPGFNQLADDKS